jgi:hypothetical protein
MALGPGQRADHRIPQRRELRFQDRQRTPQRAPASFRLNRAPLHHVAQPSLVGVTQLIDFGVFVPNAIGRGFEQWAMPPGFTGLICHPQCATLDTQSFSFPLTSSNTVTRTVIF